jgi:UDP-glucose 4-epimerase
MAKGTKAVTQYVVVGGAGFIGSHLVRALLREEPEAKVVIFDNFSSGQRWHLEDALKNPRLSIVTAEIKDSDALQQATQQTDVVYHFASNPDIAKAATQPDVDFWEGTFLTNQVIEAVRVNRVPQILYASGSGVYGDTGDLEVNEDYSPLLPISTYGASKLACEALLCSYAYMFDFKASAFRFANVVGPHQTHGVGYDFVRKLRAQPGRLDILGDGTQSKSYIHVDDVIRALRLVEKQPQRGFSYFNVATHDAVTVTEIADLVASVMQLKKVEYRYAGGDRGWKGDVPKVRLNSDKIRALGWKHQYTSQEAMLASVQSIYQDALANKFAWGETKP